MTWLITADLHLSDRPKDQYRFALFDWLAEQQQKYKVTATFILGDITDRKDNHSSLLVNETIKSLLKLQPPIFILKGNHDFVNPTNPFFEFLSYIDGIEFVGEPSFNQALGVAFLPHQTNQASFDTSCGVIRPGAAVMAHACFDGALAETGAHLPGLRSSAIEFNGPQGVWAGDIHRPQQCGPVTYVGAPFAVRFGDDFQPRVLLIKKRVGRDLHFPSLHKWLLKVSNADQIRSNDNLHQDDQVKITIELGREEVVSWSKHKQAVLTACKEKGVEVYGVALTISGLCSKLNTRVSHDPVRATRPEDVLREFCQAERVGSVIKQVGFDLLRGEE